MTSREKIMAIFNRTAEKPALWAGNPSEEFIDAFALKYHTGNTEEDLHLALGDDIRWVPADNAYHHPLGYGAIDPGRGIKRKTLDGEGVFAQAETKADIDAYEWPDVKYLDFTDIYKTIDSYQDKMVFPGMWCPFYHQIADFFGMENYFIQMYENPEIVKYATDKIVDWYVAANDIFFDGLGGRADVMFFGNDFGTQLDLMISPEMFREFVLPGFKRLIAVGKKYGKKILLHSCGSIYRIIPDLIEAGVDGLHPIQAAAKGMSANELKQYKNRLCFVGGIDSQNFFVNATPDEMKKEVKRVAGILGPNIVISPSHEKVLPNVPPENLHAMAEAAKEL